MVYIVMVYIVMATAQGAVLHACECTHDEEVAQVHTANAVICNYAGARGLDRTAVQHSAA